MVALRDPCTHHRSSGLEVSGQLLGGATCWYGVCRVCAVGGEEN